MVIMSSSVSLMQSEVTCHIYLAATGLTEREEDIHFNYHIHLKKKRITEDNYPFCS